MKISSNTNIHNSKIKSKTNLISPYFAKITSAYIFIIKVFHFYKIN